MNWILRSSKNLHQFVIHPCSYGPFAELELAEALLGEARSLRKIDLTSPSKPRAARIQITCEQRVHSHKPAFMRLVRRNVKMDLKKVNKGVIELPYRGKVMRSAFDSSSAIRQVQFDGLISALRKLDERLFIKCMVPGCPGFQLIVSLEVV